VTADGDEQGAGEGAGTPDRPFSDSLCHRCRHHRLVRGRASSFIHCTALPVKYPPQPVRACPAYEPGS
jgi:hypothetical protein